MLKKYRVSLTAAEEEELAEILNKGRHAAQKRKRAQALLLSNRGESDSTIADVVGMHRRGVEELRRRFVEEGFDLTLKGAPRAHSPRLIDGDDEAHLIAMACEQTPDGVRRWSLRLLMDRFVTLEGRKVSHETIRQVLKKTKLNLGKKRSGAFLPRKMPIL